MHVHTCKRFVCLNPWMCVGMCVGMWCAFNGGFIFLFLHVGDLYTLLYAGLVVGAWPRMWHILCVCVVQFCWRVYAVCLFVYGSG